MNCILDGSDYEELFIIAHGALTDSKNNNKPFDLNQEIKDLYEAFKDDQAYAIGLVQAYPSQLVMALTHTRELSKYHRSKGLTLDLLEDLTDTFEDINAVSKYLSPDQADKESIDAIDDSIKDQAEKPTILPKLTPDQIDKQTAILTNLVKEFIFKGVSGMATTGQQALLDPSGKWTQEKNPELDFYYKFFKVFNEEFLGVQDPEKVTINGHTGFKLKILSKTQIDIEVAKPYDQRLVKGEEAYPAVRGQAIYHGGIAVAVTDNNGDVLYFDEHYNVVGKNKGGKPIYYNVRFIKKEGDTYTTDSDIQSVQEMANNLGISPEVAHSLRQAEFKALYDLRNYINEKRKENSVLLNITGVSQGVLNIRKNLPTDIDTSINSINWDKSDIDLNIKIAKRDAPEAGERKGGLYISIPGHRSIPIQANNLSQEDIDKVLDLILDPSITDENGLPITADVKVKLIEYIILTEDGSLQVMDRKGKFIALFQGKQITPEMRQEIKDFLNIKYINPNTGQPTQYNHTRGQYTFKEPTAGNIFEEFTINDGKLIRTPIDLEQHVANHSSMKIIPNTLGKDKVITFLNGYFTFNIDSQDSNKIEKLTTSKKDTKESTTVKLYREIPVLDVNDIITQEGTKGAAVYNKKDKIIKVNRKLLKEKYAQKAWTNPRELTETLDGRNVKSFAQPLHEDQFPTYEQFEQFVIEHEYQHSQLSRAQFQKSNPNSTKGQYETEINDRALFTLSLHDNIPLFFSGKNDLGNINSSEENNEPQEKVKIFKKNNVEIKDDDGLTMNRIIPMKSQPEQIAAAKEWFDASPLSKHIKYKELFNVVNSNAWAEFINGGIKLYAGSDYTVLYHEAFHAFTQHFLSKEQKVKLYKETAILAQGKKAIKDYAKSKNVSIDKLSDYQKYLAIEELLAEGFREYVLSDGKVLGQNPVSNSIFRNILDFLKELFGIKLSQSQIITDKVLLNIEDLYAQLHIGNINNYRPSVKNAYFGQGLYSTPSAVAGETTNINDQDALLLLQSIDGIISEYQDERNLQLQINSPGDTRYTSAIFTNPEKYLKEVYNIARNKFIDKYEEFNIKIEKANEEEKPILIERRNLLEDALTNFGDPNNPIKGGGLLAFHIKKSPYMSTYTKDLDREAFEKTEEDITATRYDIKGNELSKIDLASNRVSYLIKSIKKYDTDGNQVKNELDFPVLMELNETFGKIASIIGDNNNSPAEIRTVLLKAVSENPWVDALVRKLGPTLSPHHSVNDLWTGFWAAFYMSNQKLHQTMINEISDPKTRSKSYEVLTGYASAVFRQAERDFRSHFKISDHPNPFIIDNGVFGNKLDSKSILDKYKGKLYKREFEFLKDIGIPLTDTKDTREGLKNINLEYLLDKIEMLHIKNVPITDIIQSLRDPYIFKTATGEIHIKSESSNINKILGLEVKHSGNYSNASVLTAIGNVAYETSMMSTIAVQIKAINESETFQDLINIPYMSYLDYKNNPSVRASVRLRSLYEFDPNTQTFGKRRKDVIFTLDNLDGTQNIIDNSYTDKDYSSTTSKSDKYTRLMQDIYSLFLEGKPSGITPGDKSTILSANINTIYTEGNDKHLYVDLGDFGKKGGQVNLGIERAYNILLPYLEGELQRIIDVQKHQEESFLPNIEGYTSPDKNKNISGLDFSAFKGVFKKETKDKLLELYKATTNLKNIPSTLRTEMLKDMQEYFNFTTAQTKTTLDRMLFIDKNLAGLVEKGLGEVVNSIEVSNIILKAYTVNKFIHNLDDVTLFYGDLAQYKDLDKRGSALNSTGRMFRTDDDALSYVNDVLKRPYATKNKVNKYKKFDGTLETAILAEDIERSVFYEEYEETLKDANVSDEEIKRILKPYEKMETGDAQGYITFDSYRILSKLSNRWSDQQEALYQQEINDPNSVSKKNMLEYFPVRKYQYFGPLAVQGIHTTAFHKFSLLPLIPSVIKGRKLEELHNNMMNNGIDYATFKTGSKVGTVVAPGTIGGDKLYNTDKTIAPTKYTKNTIYLNYLKDQLDINSEYKEKVIFSTQLRALIEEGLIEGGVPVDFKPELSLDERVELWEKSPEETDLYKVYKKHEDNINKLIKFRKAELRKELGSTEEELTSGKGNMAKLVRFIQKELDRQDLADHEIDFIKEKDGKLVRDLSISPIASKIEKALNAIVNNRLVRQKVNGESLVQVTNSMWEPTSSSAEEKLSWGTKDLKTYRRDKSKQTLNSSQIYSQLGTKTQFENVVIDEVNGRKPAIKGNLTLTKKNLFTVKPVQSADKKAIIKASVATQYIGFGKGIDNSSTELYRQQAEQYANTGNYSSNDVIFVSIGGKRGDEQVRKKQQDKTIKEALKAIEAGATLITDNKNYVESSNYNEGEKRLAKNLESKGYNYSEKTINNQILGVWSKNQSSKPIVAYRTRGNNFLEALEKDNAIGNPWSHAGYSLYKTNTVKEAVEEFIAWMTGEKHTDKLQDYRQAIIDKIPEMKDKPILYYKDLREPSHATALDYLINKYDWNIQPSTSKTLGMDVKVALQGNFKNLIHLVHKDGKKVAIYNKRKKEDAQGNIIFTRELDSDATLERLNETIKDPEWRSNQDNLDMITMVGVRIPVQAHNSMEFMTVYEFLPERAGNIIVPPAEIVAKSGSDFDIDKLTIMMPSISIIGGIPEIIKEQTGDPVNKLKRTDQITEELKELRIKKSSIQEEVTAKFKEVSPKDLTEDDKAEIRIAHKYFDEEIGELKKELKTYENNVTLLTNMTNLNEEQQELLGRSWVGIDEVNKYIDIMETERRNTVNDIRQEMRQEKIDTIDTSKLKAISSAINKLEKEKNSLSGKALENNLMFTIRDILQLPINYINLFTPNDTSLVRPLAEQLSKNRDYNELDGVFGKTKTRDATKYLEPAYNISVHDRNAVGKDTLGLGAVDNKYNPIFNRIGMYMNPYYLKGIKKRLRRAIILMEHNTRQTEDGQRGISLSHLYDFNNENRIANVISQLMNGWVDVAKDAWIFDIQGNKQVSPILLFLIQAGVPFRTAVYFVSNPLIKEYVKEQIIATSPFAKPNRENPKSISFYRNKAKIKIFDSIRLGGVTRLNEQNIRIIDDNKLYKTTLNFTKNIEFTKDSNYNISQVSLYEAQHSKQAIAGFLHYLELEDLSKGVSKLKLTLNYDTSKSNSLFDAQMIEANLIELQTQTMFHPKFIKAILDESPIGSFRIAPFQLELFGPLFEIRNNTTLNNFLINKLSEMKNIKKMENVFGTTERYIEEYQNDVVVKIFTDNLKKYRISDTTYKGHEVIGTKDEKQIFPRGAFYSIENNKIYIDKQTLDMQYEHDLYSNNYKTGTTILNIALRDITYGKLDLAKVPIEAFKTSENSREEYYHFVIEREYQRALNPFAELSKTHYFKYKFNKNIEKYKGLINLTGEELTNELLKRTYEEILRDTALDNIMNFWKIFKSKNTFADQLYELKEMHPNLMKYNIVKDLVISEATNKTKTLEGEEKEYIIFKNIVLRDNRVTEDLFNIYYNNMLKLSDASTISISISKDNTEQDYIENKRVSKFFSKLPLVAFLQSGLNTKDSLSIMRAMPTDDIVAIVQEEAKSFKITEDFLTNFMYKFNFQNRIQNISVRRRLKDYVTQDSNNIPNRQLAEEHEEKDLIIDPLDRKSLETFISNNPNVIFVLESSNINPEFGTGSFKNDNIVTLELKSGKEAIDMSLDNIEKLSKAGTPIAFLNRSIGYGRILTKKNKKTGQMIDQQMYEYLTTELFSRFGYENSYSRSVNEIKELIQKSQEVSDFDLNISFDDLAEARERLNCKL